MPTSYLTRIVLHELKQQEKGIYDKLHADMFAEKFYKIIKDTESGKVYELPPAEYVSGHETAASTALTRDLALKVARWVDPKCSVLTARYDELGFVGLTEISQLEMLSYYKTGIL